MKYLLIIMSLLLSCFLLAEQLTVDLVEPTYTDGVFYTEKGGIIKGENIRIQARIIRYTHRVENETQVSHLEAEGDVMVTSGKRQFVGKKLTYDFVTKTGEITDGKVCVGAWFMGGETIELRSGGGYHICKGYITTSESCKHEWKIKSEEIDVLKGDYVSAKRVQFSFFEVPLMWLPKFKTQLKSLTDAPIQFKFNVGGVPGTRATFRYRVLDWKNNKVYLRTEFILNRGVGAGIDTDHVSKNNHESFYTRSMAAHDNSIEHTGLFWRWRLHGMYKKEIPDHNISIVATYDKLSDVDMATDYGNRTFDLPTALLTYLHIGQQTENLQNDLTTRVRLNAFQTVDQELPCFESSNRPFTLGEKVGIITENRLQMAYLDYAFANYVKDASNFHSSRIELMNKLYRPIFMGPVTINPEIGFTGIFYGNTPADNDVGEGFFVAGGSVMTDLYGIHGRYKHTIQPYATYQFLSNGSTQFFDHYIFTIDDGFVNMNILRSGIRNALYKKTDDLIRPVLSTDLFTYSFFVHNTFNFVTPKYYIAIDYNPTTQINCNFNGAWNAMESVVDYANFGIAWTQSELFAIGMDYLHRSPFDWRKSDHWNFVLDLSRTVQELLDSPLSDRRDTILSRLFWQFTPNWSVEGQSRWGFNRRAAPNYFEYKIDVTTYLRCNWRLRFTYDHRVDGDIRYSVGFRLGGKDIQPQSTPPLW